MSNIYTKTVFLYYFQMQCLIFAQLNYKQTPATWLYVG